MAKDLIRTRHQIEKFYKLKSQLQGVSLRIQVCFIFTKSRIVYLFSCKGINLHFVISDSEIYTSDG